MTFDPLFLSRLQWAWVIGWHILLPAFTVGMGVVTGIVMPFQFGTNWSRFSDATANVLSPMLAYEDLMAFFLEATFLGVLLFGRKLVPRWVHLLAACMVALGTLMSSFWILAANSWMQTPTGSVLRDGRFFPVDWFAIVFNPSFPYRFAHNVTAFYVTTGFVVLGVGAFLVRRENSALEGRRMFMMALGFLALMVPLQIFLGDLQGLNTRHYQPAKLAAIEGRWQTASPAPLTLFAIPEQAQARNEYAVELPYLGSLVLTHSLDGTVQGLLDFPADRRPPVWPVFFAFRLMVGIGFLMLGVVAFGWWLHWQGRLFATGWFLLLCQCTAPLGFLAVLAGWTVTEVGRQPWTVYGLLRTARSVTPSLTGPDVMGSLLVYMVLYLSMYPAGFAVILRLIRQGCAVAEAAEPPVAALKPRAPFALSAAE